MNIFEERKFYPSEEISIKEHYSGTFDSVFLAFNPFFRVDETHLDKPSFQRVHQITYPEFKKVNPDLDIPESLGDIYSNEKPDYPTAEEVLLHGAVVRWEEVRVGCRFESFVELNKALATTIGGYRRELKRKDLADRLLAYSETEKVFLPEEGTFDVFTKVAILKTFRKLNKGFIVIENEYLDKKETIDIRTITDEEFCKQIEFKDYYIYDIEQEILFAVDWDDFFFLICSTASNLTEILSDGIFEGFYCDDGTRTYWEFTEEELQKGLADDQSHLINN